MTTEGIEVRSVGNTLTLHETALIEAFNLKAAIEYQLKNCEYCTEMHSLIFNGRTTTICDNINQGLMLIKMECPFFQKRNSQALLRNKEITHTLTYGSTRYNL